MLSLSKYHLESCIPPSGVVHSSESYEPGKWEESNAIDKIVLPAFLPLKHHQPSSVLLNEAFPPNPSGDSTHVRLIGALAPRQAPRKPRLSNIVRRSSDGSTSISSNEANMTQERKGVHIGGLRTGAEVYDGVEIPGASVHLQSDDEDQDAEPGGMRRTRSAKGSLMKQPSRLLSAMRGTSKTQAQDEAVRNC
jgi:cell division septation protein DedD